MGNRANYTFKINCRAKLKKTKIRIYMHTQQIRIRTRLIGFGVNLPRQLWATFVSFIRCSGFVSDSDVSCAALRSRKSGEFRVP